MEFYTFYKSKGLLFSGICPKCKAQLPIIQFYKTSHGTQEPIYFCSKHRLQFTSRHWTIFQHIKVSLNIFDLILKYYLSGFSISQIRRILGLLPNSCCSLKTIKKYTKIFRNIIHIFVQRELLNLMLPGPVEVDEACLYRLRKSNRGRLAKTICWVFGMKCRSTRRIVIYPVLYRTRGDLIPLIRAHVIPGATIYSDRFSAYFNNRVKPSVSHLSVYGYNHFGINHSKHFVSKFSDQIHTNTIERTWRSLKEKLKYNKPRIETDKFISEFMFENWVPAFERYDFMINLIAYFHQEFFNLRSTSLQ